MDEKYFDSSVFDYEIEYKSEKYIKQKGDNYGRKKSRL